MQKVTILKAISDESIFVESYVDVMSILLDVRN